MPGRIVKGMCHYAVHAQLNQLFGALFSGCQIVAAMQTAHHDVRMWKKGQHDCKAIGFLRTGDQLADQILMSAMYAEATETFAPQKPANIREPSRIQSPVWPV